jgi:hypothetical protein
MKLKYSIGLIYAFIVLNSILYCFEQNRWHRLPYHSEVGASDNKLRSNIHNSLLVCLSGFALLAATQRFSNDVFRLNLAYTMPFLTVLAVSFDTKHYQTAHVLLTHLTVLIVSLVFCSKTTNIFVTLIIFIVTIMYLVLKPKKNREVKEKEEKNLEICKKEKTFVKTWHKINPFIQNALLLGGVYNFML